MISPLEAGLRYKGTCTDDTVYNPYDEWYRIMEQNWQKPYKPTRGEILEIVRSMMEGGRISMYDLHEKPDYIIETASEFLKKLHDF